MRAGGGLKADLASQEVKSEQKEEGKRPRKTGCYIHAPTDTTNGRIYVVCICGLPGLQFSGPGHLSG